MAPSLLSRAAMLSRGSLASFLSLTIACGRVDAPPPAGSTRAPATVAPPVMPPSAPVTTHDHVTVFTRAGEQLSLVDVDLRDAALGMVYRELPHPAADVTFAEALDFDLVSFDLKDGRTSLEAAGYPKWRVLATSAPHEHLAALGDSSMVWATTIPDGHPELAHSRAFALAHGGIGDSSEWWTSATLVYEDSPNAPPARYLGQTTRRFLFQKADGIYVVAAEVDRDTPDRLVERPGEGAFVMNTVDVTGVEAMFEGSFLLRGDYPGLRWLNYQGESVPFAPAQLSQQTVHGTLMLANGVLSELRKDGPVVLQNATSVASASDLVHVDSGHYALVHSGSSFAIIASDGAEAATYGPESPKPCAHGRPSPEVMLSGFADAGRDAVNVLLLTRHVCMEGDALYDGPATLDFWTVDYGAKHATVKRLATYEGEAPLFRLSEYGAFAWAIHDGNIETIDTSTGAQRTLDLGRTVLDWRVH